jgi:hypothetical protein
VKTREIIPGSKVGRLTIQSTPHRVRGKLYALCLCDCGKSTQVRISSLGNSTNSCGCLLRANLEGSIIGDLTIVECADRTSKKNEGVYWNCLCKCGVSVQKITKYLTSNKSQIKACTNCNRFRRLSKDPGSATWNTLFRHYRVSATKRNLVFDIDFDKFKEICEQNCHYCAKVPSPRNAYSSPSLQINRAVETIISAWINANGIDRLNNDLGYIATNVVPCCPDCNYAKQELSKNNFFKLIKKIYEHNNLHCLDLGLITT